MSVGFYMCVCVCVNMSGDIRWVSIWVCGRMSIHLCMFVCEGCVCLFGWLALKWVDGYSRFRVVLIAHCTLQSLMWYYIGVSNAIHHCNSVRLHHSNTVITWVITVCNAQYIGTKILKQLWIRVQLLNMNMDAWVVICMLVLEHGNCLCSVL